VNPVGRAVNIAPELLLLLTRRASSVAHFVQTGACIASAAALANDAAWSPTWVNPPPIHPVVKLVRPPEVGLYVDVRPGFKPFAQLGRSGSPV
jgi:hypothetical protein